jgi:hypothetical protein
MHIERPLGLLAILAMLTSPAWGYWLYTYHQHRTECAELVSFVPASESVTCAPGTFCTPKQGEAEHYEFTNAGFVGLSVHKFKSKGEAISYCMGHN